MKIGVNGYIDLDFSYQILLYICEILEYFHADVASEINKFQCKGFPEAKKIKKCLTIKLNLNVYSGNQKHRL